MSHGLFPYSPAPVAFQHAPAQTVGLIGPAAAATIVGLSPHAVVAAIDCESSKLYIPARHVRSTDGLTRTEAVRPAICRLYLNGRCRQGARCHQVHAEAQVVHRLRAEVLANPSCCTLHSKAPSALLGQAPIPPSLMLELDGSLVSIAQIEPTKGILEICEKAKWPQQVVCSQAQLCRNHCLGSMCRFGDDCGYLHICKQLGVRAAGAPLAPPQIQNPTTLPLTTTTSQAGHTSLLLSAVHVEPVQTHSMHDNTESLLGVADDTCNSPNQKFLLSSQSTEVTANDAALVAIGSESLQGSLNDDSAGVVAEVVTDHSNSNSRDATAEEEPALSPAGSSHRGGFASSGGPATTVVGVPVGTLASCDADDDENPLGTNMFLPQKLVVGGRGPSPSHSHACQPQPSKLLRRGTSRNTSASSSIASIDENNCGQPEADAFDNAPALPDFARSTSRDSAAEHDSGFPYGARGGSSSSSTNRRAMYRHNPYSGSSSMTVLPGAAAQ